MLFTRIRSGAFVVKNKKVLLFQRSLGYWYFLGGQVEKGETPEKGAIREVEEETGIKVKLTKLLYVRELRRRGDRTLELIYLAKAVGGKLRLCNDPEEKYQMTKLEYIPINSINKALFLTPALIDEIEKDAKNSFKDCPRDLGISKSNFKKFLTKR